MFHTFRLSLFAVVGLLIGSPSYAHFQVLRPSEDIVDADGPQTVHIEAVFTHPMENGPVMDMGPPRRFGVLVAGKKVDLLDTLRPKKVDGRSAYEATHRVQRPADYVFYIEPAPYWEPAEQKMIIHYAKVVVDGFGAEVGWDAMVGLPVEIEPLVRPYGLWTGNVFRGVVRRDGEPVPFAEIEVEYLNADQEITPPSSPFVTQVIKANADGEFCYAMPRAGWWGFAALVEGEEKIENPDGRQVDVELGGLIWVRTRDME